jgi:plastocyanin
MKPQLLSLLVLLGPASAAVHTVTVGVGGLVYNPSSLEAAVGDTVVFQFSSQVS